MAEGHIVLPLSNLCVCVCVCVCVCMCVFVCVFPELCLTHNFLLLGGISKLFGTNNHHDKTICCVPEPCWTLEGQDHTSPPNVRMLYSDFHLCPTHNFDCMVRFQNFSALVVITSLRVKITLAM